MLRRLSVILFLTMSPISGSFDGCGGRLERALDALHRESIRRNRLDDDDNSAYRQQLQTAPLEMTVSRVAVKLPQDSNTRSGPWAQVEKCAYQPNDNSIQTRVVFNDLSVSGLVSLVPRDYRANFPSESCRMTLRLRRAGIEFYTSPIARGRGTMRIRTESSFMEPRFASIYAYGCRPTRVDKQIKRQDKWPPHQKPDDKVISIPTSVSYDAAEPRELVGVANEEDVAIINESRQSRALYAPDARLGIWRKSKWITRADNRKRRSLDNLLSRNLELPNSNNNKTSIDNHTQNRPQIGNLQPTSAYQNTKTFNQTQPVKNLADETEVQKSSEVITPKDFVAALAKWAGRVKTDLSNLTTDTNLTRIPRWKADSPEKKDDQKEKLDVPQNETPRETREILDEQLSDNLEGPSRDWQSRESVAREMEDVFLRGASQALTQYIEKQLHPAIKETLMLSMGYTISYG